MPARRLDALETVQAFGREAQRRRAVRRGGRDRLHAPRWPGSRARALMTALVMVLIFGGVGVDALAGGRAPASSSTTA